MLEKRIEPEIKNEQGEKQENSASLLNRIKAKIFSKSGETTDRNKEILKENENDPSLEAPDKTEIEKVIETAQTETQKTVAQAQEKIVQLESEIQIAQEQGQTIKAAGLQKEKEYQQKEITIAKAQEKLADLKPESHQAKKTEKQIRQKQAEQDIFELRKEIAGLKQGNPELTQKRQELQNAKITAEKEKTIGQKARELFTNKEVGKRFIMGQVNALATSLGVRTVYSLPAWLWQRANVKGEWGRDGLQKHLEKTLEASQKTKPKRKERTEEIAYLKSIEESLQTEKDPDKKQDLQNLKEESEKLIEELKADGQVSQKAEMAEMMKIVKMTKEGGQKNSTLRRELANTIRKNRAENSLLNEEEATSIKKLIDKHAETKINGLEVARDGLNSACVVGGAWYLRIFSKGLFDAANRYQKLQREAKPGDEKVGFWKDAVVKGVVETFQKAAFVFGKDKTTKQRGLEFAQAASTLMSYYGMGTLSLLRPEVITADIDRIINTFGGGQDLGQMMENMGQNFFENAAIVGGRYAKIAEIAAKPFHEDQSANTPGQSTDMGDSLTPSEIIKPKPATAEVPDMEPAKIILEERPMVTPKESATLSSAPEIATTPPPQQSIEIKKPTIQTIEPVAPEAQSPILPPLGETEQPLIQTEHLVAEPPKQEDFSLRQSPSPREMPAVDLMPPKTADSLELAHKALNSDILKMYHYVREDIPQNLSDANGVHTRLDSGQGITFHQTSHGTEYRLDGQGQDNWQSIDDLSETTQASHVPLPNHEASEPSSNRIEPQHETASEPKEKLAETWQELKTNEQLLSPETKVKNILADADLRQQLNELPPAKDGKYETFATEQLYFRRNASGQLEYSLDNKSYAIAPDQLQPSSITNSPTENNLSQQEEAQAILEDKQRLNGAPEVSPQPADEQPQPQPEAQHIAEVAPTTELEAPVITNDAINDVIKNLENSGDSSPLLPLLKENRTVGVLLDKLKADTNDESYKQHWNELKNILVGDETNPKNYSNITDTEKFLIEKYSFNLKELAKITDEKSLKTIWQNFLENNENLKATDPGKLKRIGTLLSQLQILKKAKAMRDIALSAE